MALRSDPGVHEHRMFTRSVKRRRGRRHHRRSGNPKPLLFTIAEPERSAAGRVCERCRRGCRGDGGHRTVHADDAGVDRHLRPLQWRRNSRFPFILIRCRAADGFGELFRPVVRPGPIGSTTGSFAPCRLVCRACLIGRERSVRRLPRASPITSIIDGDACYAATTAEWCLDDGRHPRSTLHHARRCNPRADRGAAPCGLD